MPVFPPEPDGRAQADQKLGVCLVVAGPGSQDPVRCLPGVGEGLPAPLQPAVPVLLRPGGPVQRQPGGPLDPQQARDHLPARRRLARHGGAGRNRAGAWRENRARRRQHVKGRPYPRHRANLPPEYSRQPPVHCLRPDTKRQVQRPGLPPPVDRLPQPRDILTERVADEGIAREAALILRPPQCLVRRRLPGTGKDPAVQRQPGVPLALEQARDHLPG